MSADANQQDRPKRPHSKRLAAALAVTVVLIFGAGVVGVLTRSTQHVYSGLGTPDAPSVPPARDASAGDGLSGGPVASAAGPQTPMASPGKGQSSLGGSSAARPTITAAGSSTTTVAAGSGPPRFESVCPYSHTANDDPIVHFGDPGASHSHDFFGNTSTNAFSVDQTMRSSATTCHRPLDTAGYWVPTLQADGRVVHPMLTAYYLALPTVAPDVRAFPQGLKYATRYGQGVVWGCLRGTTSRPTTFPPTCPHGTQLVLSIVFPDCWDGVNLDSADHRSHMAFSSGGSCPATHPVTVPQLRLALVYRIDGVGQVVLSSGGPETAHADFFNTWDQVELATVVRDCLNVDGHCGVSGR